MTRLLTLAVLLSAFFFTLSSGTYCLGRPDSIKKGQQCAGSNAACQYGTYCDDAGICSPLLDIGAACLDSSDCVAGANCQGANGDKICVGYAGIGETCQTDDTVKKPMCTGSGSSCDATEKVCVGGRAGDTCKKSSAINVCIGELKCTDSVCTAIADGGNCTANYDCLATSFCNHDSVQRICQPRKQSGSCHTSHECTPGTYCLGPDEGQCVPEKTLKVGEFCRGYADGENIHALCDSLRCADSGFCSAGLSMYDDGSDYPCSEREVSTCGGLEYDDGPVMSCTNNPCYDLEKTFGDCIQKNCAQCVDARCLMWGDYSIDNTPGRCYANNCDKEFTAMRACNGAGQLIGSVFVAAFVALIASFVSKRF